MPGTVRVLEGFAERIEHLELLDRAADATAAVLRRLLPAGPVEDLVTGTPTGHPAHPPLVAVPLGAWTSAVALDLVGADAKATRAVVGIGLVGAVPSVVTGAADWLTTAGAERRVGLVHGVVNIGAFTLEAASWAARGRGQRGRGAALSMAAAGLLTVGGWLGGHLPYALGVGVDTTAFQRFPSDWTDAVGADEVTTRPLGVEVGGVPIVLFRADDQIVALADRCTHRGGALHEGELRDGCITCPWHGSSFAVDGTVRSGPATRPQPRLEARVVNNRVQVRRDEERTLRMNPVGR